jgi:CHAD domain-containing protein
MAFHLKSNESVKQGITRAVKREIEKAFQQLHAKEKTETAHEVRKCFKKVRAALRLVRDDLGEDAYHEENFALRDAARPLTEVRDADVLVETLAKLDPSRTFEKVRLALLANQKEVAQRVLEKQTLDAVERLATRALARLPKWTIDAEGWTAVEGGLRRTYRAGHRSLARAAETPSVENLHELRKQSKYVWHQLQLVQPDKELGDRFHALSTLLGDDHDLAVLRQTLSIDPLAYGGHPVLKQLFVLVDREREKLDREAFVLARQLYADSPKAFTSRIAPTVMMAHPSAVTAAS